MKGILSEHDLPDFLKRWIREGKLLKFLVYTFIGIAAFVFFSLAILSYLRIMAVGEPIDFILFAILSASGIYGFYEYKRLKKIRQIDERIPDFLRDLAESRRAGMTFTKAIMFAAKGDYGILTDEIKKIAQQISWGSSVNEALNLFAQRVDTPLAHRAVSLINEASRSGGNVSDILYAASKDAREIKEVNVERRITMVSYVVVVYVAAFVFLAVVAIVSSTFLPAMAKGGAQGLSDLGGTFAGGGADPAEVTRIFYYAALIQSYGSGMVAGVFEQGNLPSGIKHSFILVLISWVIFRFFIL